MIFLEEGSISGGGRMFTTQTAAMTCDTSDNSVYAVIDSISCSGCANIMNSFSCSGTVATCTGSTTSSTCNTRCQAKGCMSGSCGNGDCNCLGCSNF